MRLTLEFSLPFHWILRMKISVGFQVLYLE